MERTMPRDACVPRILGVLIVLLFGLHAHAASAQWNPRLTASLSRSFGQLALSQSVLSETHQSNEAVPAPRSDNPEASLTFTPDPQLSNEIRAGVIDILSRQSPEMRWQMQRVFGGDAVLNDFKTFLQEHGGYSSYNVADCMAALLVISWEITTNDVASEEDVRGAHAQVRSVFLNTPRLQQMTNAERQELAEKSAYQVIIAQAGRELYLHQPDGEHLRQLQASAALVMQQQGMDLSRITLTAQGFKKP
jgi:hypothetical protein